MSRTFAHIVQKKLGYGEVKERVEVTQVTRRALALEVAAWVSRWLFHPLPSQWTSGLILTFRADVLPFLRKPWTGSPEIRFSPQVSH